MASKGGQHRHFACTLCGRCCDRSPEIALSEAAELADVFVFRLMFRLVPTPNFKRDERHVANFAARRLSRAATGGWPAFLVISALSIDNGGGRCAALADRQCSIHERRPLSCRSVPFHYSRADHRLLPAFDRFVGTPGYECDASTTAPLVFEGDEVIDPGTRDARLKAIWRSGQDQGWERAIIARLPSGPSDELPSISDLVACADRGALTASMRVAWEIAVAEGLMTANSFNAAVNAQIATIDRMLRVNELEADDRRTIIEMRREYALTRASLPAPALSS